MSFYPMEYGMWKGMHFDGKNSQTDFRNLLAVTVKRMCRLCISLTAGTVTFHLTCIDQSRLL